MSAGRPQPDGRYNPPAMQWAPATDPDTGLTQNPYAAGGGQSVTGGDAEASCA